MTSVDKLEGLSLKLENSRKTSRFQKSMRIPGTKFLRNCNQLFTSSGVDSFDRHIGGGIAIGSCVLIEEESPATCSNLLIQYFFAEGFAHEHQLFFITKCSNSFTLLKNLPLPLSIVEEQLQFVKQSDSETMKIAWQYQHKPLISSVESKRSSSRMYDSNKTIEWNMLEKANPIIYSPKEQDHMSFYDQLLQKIVSTVEDKRLANRVIRLCLQSIHSPSWYQNDSLEENCRTFCTFLYKLRAILRNSLCICYLTVPTYFTTNLKWQKRIHRFCDTVVTLNSIDGHLKAESQMFKNYQGILHVKKLPTINTQNCFIPVCKEFGFKIERKKLSFEILHLPPLSDSTSADFGCGRSGKSNLNF